MAWLAGTVLLHDLNPWLLADLAPAISFARDHRIPERLRQVLNAESGLNDGIIAPVGTVRREC